jgi:tyrosinase
MSAVILVINRSYPLSVSLRLYDSGLSSLIPNKNVRACRYWNWPLYTDDLATSPLFDGSDTSLSGDGIYDPADTGYDIDGETLPRGTGGGCVASGPFENLTLHLGPFDYNLTSRDSLPSWAFAYNPRCFTRSLNTEVLARFNNQNAIDALLASKDITAFQHALDNFPNPQAGVAGVHGGAHLCLGEPIQDAFAGPQDPAFMLHHAMVDRLWVMWQDADRDARLYQTNGTSSIFNKPRTPEVTLGTKVDFGILGISKRVGDLMDSRRYCYVYE